MFSLSKFLSNLFTREVIVPVFQSELSNPVKCKRVRYQNGLDNHHIHVLKIIGNQNGIRASELDRIYNSGGRRANDLLHLGYVDNIGKKTIMKYVLNDKGMELLFKI